jgi:hypothetical protein
MLQEYLLQEMRLTKHTDKQLLQLELAVWRRWMQKDTWLR